MRYEQKFSYYRQIRKTAVFLGIAVFLDLFILIHAIHIALSIESCPIHRPCWRGRSRKPCHSLESQLLRATGCTSWSGRLNGKFTKESWRMASHKYPKYESRWSINKLTVRGNWSFELEKTFRLEGEKKHWYGEDKTHRGKQWEHSYTSSLKAML